MIMVKREEIVASRCVCPIGAMLDVISSPDGKSFNEHWREFEDSPKFWSRFPRDPVFYMDVKKESFGDRLYILITALRGDSVAYSNSYFESGVMAVLEPREQL